MNWFRKMMIGRYGTDNLTFAMFILSIIVSLIARGTHSYALSILSTGIVVLCLLRIFSRNTAKRYRENVRFMKTWSPIQYWIESKVRLLKDSKTHRYYKCPNCSMRLRVPRNRGKININCPKCHTQFIKKT